MRRILTTLAVSLLALPALAEPFEPGPYLAVNAGRATISSKYADRTGDLTLGAALGYQYTQALGVELYTRSLSLNPFRGVLSEAGFYPDTHYGIAALGSMHIDQHTRLYARLGIGRTTMKGNRSGMNNHDDTDALLGVGTGYAFNRNWSMTLEGSYLTNSEVTLLSAGLRYQF